MVVKLKGGAKDAQSSMAGVYILGPKMVDGKSHWLQDQGKNAIWYHKDHWNIANYRYLGSNQAFIYSLEDVASPQEATAWRYYNRKWITSKDIFVEGTKSKIFCQKLRHSKESNVFVFIQKRSRYYININVEILSISILFQSKQSHAKKFVFGKKLMI